MYKKESNKLEQRKRQIFKFLQHFYTYHTYLKDMTYESFTIKPFVGKFSQQEN